MSRLIHRANHIVFKSKTRNLFKSKQNHLSINMYSSPRETAAVVVERAKHVQIHTEGVKKLAQEISKHLLDGSLSINGFSQFELHPSKDDPYAPDELFLIDTLNFCFWSPDEEGPKWCVLYKDQKYTGYFALCAAVCRAKAEGIPIVDPKFYSSVTKETLEKIFRSDSEVSIPLLDERVECLHEVGKVLINEYNGTFKTCIEQSDKSSKKLLNLIIDKFPCFRDEATYQGLKVAIYKRAQILVGDIWACFRGKDLGEFTDIEEITMFADYRVPQVLIHFGSMSYTKDLLDKLERNELLSVGSEEEVEIRACSIHIVELVIQELKRAAENELPELKNKTFNSIMVDHFLWDYRRKYAAELNYIPFHKTKGIYY